MKVFVLGYLSDPTDDTSSSDVLGAFKTEEEAQSAMRKELAAKKSEFEITDENIDLLYVKVYEGEYEASLCHYGSYYCWTIYEFEI